MMGSSLVTVKDPLHPRQRFVTDVRAMENTGAVGSAGSGPKLYSGDHSIKSYSILAKRIDVVILLQYSRTPTG